MKTKLFCLPYAGGSASFYTNWKALISDDVELYPLELAGRGKRFGETFCKTMNEVVNDLFPFIKDNIENCRYAFWGYSLGAIIVYELMRKIIENNLNLPIHIFFAGRFPPHIRPMERIDLLANNLFRKKILEYGGVPREIASNEEILNIFMMIIKADYKVLGSYQYIHLNPWPFNISILGGLQDEEMRDYGYSEWEKYTTKCCNFYSFEGNHFFVKENEKTIIDLINNTLN